MHHTNRIENEEANRILYNLERLLLFRLFLAEALLGRITHRRLTTKYIRSDLM